MSACPDDTQFKEPSPYPQLRALSTGLLSKKTNSTFSAYCVEPADLSRIAHLLGVPTVEDERPDCYGSRHRWAHRDFGRVSLRAYTSIETEPAP